MKCPHCTKEFRMGVTSGSCPHCFSELFLSQCGVCCETGFMDNTDEAPELACSACDGNGWVVSLTPLGE